MEDLGAHGTTEAPLKAAVHQPSNDVSHSTEARAQDGMDDPDSPAPTGYPASMIQVTSTYYHPDVTRDSSGTFNAGNASDNPVQQEPMVPETPDIGQAVSPALPTVSSPTRSPTHYTPTSHPTTTSPAQSRSASHGREEEQTSPGQQSIATTLHDHFEPSSSVLTMQTLHDSPVAYSHQAHAQLPGVIEEGREIGPQMRTLDTQATLINSPVQQLGVNEPGHQAGSVKPSRREGAGKGYDKFKSPAGEFPTSQSEGWEEAYERQRRKRWNEKVEIDLRGWRGGNGAPHSAYMKSAVPTNSYYGQPVTGTIGQHLPKEIIRVERDWSEGEVCQFETAYPMELEGRITPQKWRDFIEALNRYLSSAYSVRGAVVDNLIAIATWWTSILWRDSHFERELRAAERFIDDMNHGVFNPAGLNILSPRQMALQYLEIEYY